MVRARVPAAGRSRETIADFVAPLPFRERVFGFRPFDLVLRTRLAAGELTVKCPFPFMISSLSSFQAQGMAGRVGFANPFLERYTLGFQILKQIYEIQMGRKNWVFLVRFAPGIWILVIYTSACIYQIAASRAFGFLAPKAVRRFSGYPNERLLYRARATAQLLK